MKKFIIFCLSIISLTCYAQVSSIYTQKPNDPEAVYFTPENFDIKADGSVDVSDALQQAVNQVKEKYNFGIVFIPEGKYKISKTIYIPPAVRIIGYGNNRPEIFLGKKSPGYQQENLEDKGNANYMLWFTGGMVRPGGTPRDAGAGTFYSAISNVNLRIEDGNPYAVALRTHFAQHSFVSNVDIYAGNAKAGLYDVGNYMENVRFFGGNYGIYTTKTSPSWQMMMVDVYFEGQKTAAIKTQEGGLTLVRLYAKNVPVVFDVDPERSDKIFLENCTFENVTKAGIIISNEDYPHNQVSMINVVCKKVPVFAMFRRSGKLINGESTIYRVKDFSHGVHIKDMSTDQEFKTVIDIEPLKKMPDAHRKDIPTMPQMKNWANVLDFGAKGDGVSDDTEAFKKAIAQSDVVYVPQGWYIISETLTLKESSSLIGLNPISTQLILQESTPAFSGFGSPKPLLESSVGGNNYVSGIGLNTGAYNYRAVGCKWMAGEGSLLNDVKFVGGHGTMWKNTIPRATTTATASRRQTSRISSPSNPVAEQGLDTAWDKQYWSLWITNGGGGTFTDIWTANTYSTNGIYVNNTSTEGRIYAMSIEHHVRNEARFKNVSNWKIYAFQLEEETREGKDVQQIELEDCKNIIFGNLYLFRVIRVITPLPYAIRVWGDCENIEFYNVHNFTQMRYTTDMVAYNVNTEQVIRPWQLTRATITGNEADLSPLSNKEGVVERVVTGFEYAEGMAKDSKGNVYFCEQRMRRIYKWDVSKERLYLIADFPWQPLSLACDMEDNLLVVFKYYPQPGYLINGKPEPLIQLPDAANTTYSHWGNSDFSIKVYSIDPNNPEETIKPLQLVPRNTIKYVTKALYPSHRWRDIPDFYQISVAIPENCFVAPDGVTIIPQFYDLARTSSILEAIPGEPFYATDEYNRIVAKMNVNVDGSLSNPEQFTNQGEKGTAVDNAGNLYIGDGNIYIYNAKGEKKEVIITPERPSSLVCAGQEGNKIFFTSRSSLFQYTIPSDSGK